MAKGKDLKKNILCINFGGIGDEILFLPTIISLKKCYPESKITLALESRSKGVVDLTSKIDDVICVDIKTKNKVFEVLKLIFKARSGHYDIVVASGSSPYMSLIMFLTGIKERYGYDTGFLSKRLLTTAIPLNKEQYAAQMYHDLIMPISHKKTTVPELEIGNVKKTTDTILIHPGVSLMSIQKECNKNISAQTWAEVADMLLQKGKKVILTGGPDDIEIGTKILSLMKECNNPKFVYYVNKTKSLKDLARLIAACEKFICPDSCPLHIAVAVGTKTYAIFGPTDFRKLVPQCETVLPLTNDDNCSIKPCLWEKRLTTCKNLDCLKFVPEFIVNQVLTK